MSTQDDERAELEQQIRALVREALQPELDALLADIAELTVWYAVRAAYGDDQADTRTGDSGRWGDT